jgi:hypothetical protein
VPLTPWWRAAPCPCLLPLLPPQNARQRTNRLLASRHEKFHRYADESVAGVQPLGSEVLVTTPRRATLIDARSLRRTAPSPPSNDVP